MSMNVSPLTTHQCQHFPSIRSKWNTNQEVAQILYSVGGHPEWLSGQVKERPQSGAQFLFKRYNDNYFKADGYIWKRRREGKVIREDHMKLKVQKQEIISANYAHSAIVPSFHRRVYWLTANPDVVLVHYLNSSDDDRNDGRGLDDRIEATMRTASLNLSHQDLLNQISPILSPSISPQEIMALANVIWSRFNNPSNGTGLLHQHMLERRNSCSSAFRKGLSSVALRRQPSTFSDSIDPHFIGDVVRNCGKVDGGPMGQSGQAHFSHHHDAHGYGREESQRSRSGETHRGSVDDNETSYCCAGTMADQGIRSTSQQSTGGGPSSASGGDRERDRERPSPVPIIDLTPNHGSIEGGEKVLLIGGWYLKGHDYSLQFGEHRVPAQLIHVGVLSAHTPQVSEAETVNVRVLCDGLIVSTPTEFTYSDERMKREEIIQLMIDRWQLFTAAFINVQQQQQQQQRSPFATHTSHINENTFLLLARTLQQQKMVNPQILDGTQQLPSRTLLHLAAMLDYHRFTEYLLAWRRNLPYTRELDPLSRDAEGSTPLHLAVKTRNSMTVQVLVKACRSTVDMLDDRGRTPSDLTSDPGLSKLTARIEESSKANAIPTSIEDAEHMTATALWVFTNGETVTDERRQCKRIDRMRVHSSSVSPASQCDDTMGGDASSSASMMVKRKSDWKTCEQPIHVEISMDTADVHVPDSPKMADLFEAVTSPGVFVNDCVREKMAQLAQHIIDALPERIKGDPPQTSNHHHHMHSPDETTNHVLSFAGESPMFASTSSGGEFVMPDMDDCMNFHFPVAISHHNAFSSRPILATDDGSGMNSANSPFRQAVSHLYPFGRDSFSSSRATTTLESGSFDLDNSKDLGEFLSIEAATTDVFPLQQQLGDLRLTESEQRDVYEAAKTIQRAYREYRARASTMPHPEAERNAAITIQSFYRRYKAFQYFKRLYNAAILVQKHFRMKKKDQSGVDGGGDQGNDRLPDHPSIDGTSIRIQIPPNSSNLWRENQAATTIQRTYRDHRHRKRQAAARKIQNFMRQSRIKLRKMHEQNAAECTMGQRVEIEVGLRCNMSNNQATLASAQATPPPLSAGSLTTTTEPLHAPPQPPHQQTPSAMALNNQRRPSQSLIPPTISMSQLHQQMVDFTNTASACPPPTHPQSSVPCCPPPLSITGLAKGTASAVPLSDDNHKMQPTQRLSTRVPLGTNATISLQGAHQTAPLTTNMTPTSTRFNQQTVPLPPIHTIQPSANNNNHHNMLNGK